MWIAALAFLRPSPSSTACADPRDLRRAARTADGTQVIHEIGDGFAFVWRLPVLRWLLLAMSIANLGGVGLRVLILYVLREEHHLDEVTIGLALSASGAFMILGSLLAPRLAQGRPMGHSMIGVILASGFAALAAAIANDWRIILLCFTGREIAWQAFIIYAFIPRQRDVPANMRGRANGAFRTVVLIANSASPAVRQRSSSSRRGRRFAVAGLGLVSAAVAALRRCVTTPCASRPRMM